MKTGIQRRMAVSPYMVSLTTTENAGAHAPDTEAPSAADAPADPFAHIEKTIDQQTWVQTKKARLTELQESADRLSSDPYVVSTALRRKFREEKKVMLEKQGRDDGLKEKYGLHDDMDLGDEDVEKSRAIWEAGRERAGLPIEDNTTDSAESSVRGVAGTPRPRGQDRSGGKVDLVSVLRKTTAKKYDPFADAVDSLFSATSVRMKTKSKGKDLSSESEKKGTGKRPETPKSVAVASLGGGLLSGYASD